MLRVQLLRLLKNRETDSMKAACQICGITPERGYDLWKKYRGKGLDALLRFDWKPRAAKLSPEQQAKLPERAAADDGFGSQAEAAAYPESEFGVARPQRAAAAALAGNQNATIDNLNIKAYICILIVIFKE